MTEKFKKVALYLGWKYIPFGGDLQAGWYRPLLNYSYAKHFERIDGKEYQYVCRNHHQLCEEFPLEFVFHAVEKIEKENTDFGYSWEDEWNNVAIVFSMFQGTMEFEMERKLDPAKTISERKINYQTLKEDLVEMICETLNYLENARKD